MSFIKGITGIFATLCFSFLGYEALGFAREKATSIRVYGLADMMMISDRGELLIKVKEEDNDIKNLYTKLEKSLEKLGAYLKKQGFDASEITDEGVYIYDEYPSNYQQYYNRKSDNNEAVLELPANRYKLESSIRIQSDDVEKIKKTVSSISKLLADGLLFSTRVYYSCKNFDKIRLKLIEDATADSLKRAEVIAKATKCKVTGLKTITTKTIKILSGDRTVDDDSWSDGEYSFKKRFRVVVEAIYAKN